VISDNILNDPDIETVVKLASYECYVQQSGDGVLKDRILTCIGYGFRLLREAGPDPLYTPYSFAELTDIVVRDRLINELKAVVDDLDALDPPHSHTWLRTTNSWSCLSTMSGMRLSVTNPLFVKR
jgi:hypothetical protein